MDTGMAIDRAEFFDALSSVVDPRALRWVWLTHDDADHTGNIEAVLELAPNARLATPAFAALRMGSPSWAPTTRSSAIWWPPSPASRATAPPRWWVEPLAVPLLPQAPRARCERPCSRLPGVESGPSHTGITSVVPDEGMIPSEPGTRKG